MARDHASLTETERWSYWPVMVTILMLAKLGILKDGSSGAQWLVDHALRIAVN